MLRSTSTVARLACRPATRRTNGRPDVTNHDDHQGEVLGPAEPRREPQRDARLLLREAAGVAAERQARDRRRRHGQEAARAADAAAPAERRQARDAGTPGGRREPGGPRAAGTRAEIGRAAA